MNLLIEQSDPIPDTVYRILHALPEWFGIDEAIEEYVEAARRLPTYVARIDGRVVGVCLIEQHNAASSEIHLLAVEPDHHRGGFGRALLDRVTADLAAEGCAYLQVKTLGPSRPSPEYDATRRFYEAVGFHPLQEFPADELWEGNPCLIMVQALRPAQTTGMASSREHG